MRRRIRSISMIAALVFLIAGCGTQKETVTEADDAQVSDQEVPEEKEDLESADPGEEQAGEEQDEEEPVKSGGDRAASVQVALVTDVSSVMDNGFNQAALQGIQTYAGGAGVVYECYSTEEDTLDSYEETILQAIQDKAELIICAGSHYEQAVGRLQRDYSDICFLLLDGAPRDAYGNITDVEANVHCITYKEEEAGYLVGYMAVLEGYRQFGFVGGEELPSVQRYGYGYLQGIDAAAASLECGDEVQIDYWYADTFSPNKQIEEISAEWYQAGTEIIFVCGGALYQSVLSAAEECGGMLIGADVDQSGLSELFLTSAMKGIESSIIVALDDFFASGRKWPQELAGNVVSYGAKEKCISLPVQNSAWRFQTATMEEYLRVLARLRAGEIQISVEPGDWPGMSVTVIYHNQQEERDS